MDREFTSGHRAGHARIGKDQDRSNRRAIGNTLDRGHQSNVPRSRDILYGVSNGRAAVLQLHDDAVAEGDIELNRRNDKVRVTRRDIVSGDGRQSVGLSGASRGILQAGGKDVLTVMVPRGGEG